MRLPSQKETKRRLVTRTLARDGRARLCWRARDRRFGMRCRGRRGRFFHDRGAGR